MTEYTPLCESCERPLIPPTTPYEVVVEELAQARAEITRLREGIGRVLSGRVPKGHEDLTRTERMSLWATFCVDELHDVLAEE